MTQRLLEEESFFTIIGDEVTDSHSNQEEVCLSSISRHMTSKPQIK